MLHLQQATLSSDKISEHNSNISSIICILGCPDHAACYLQTKIILTHVKTHLFISQSFIMQIHWVFLQLFIFRVAIFLQHLLICLLA
jgi:hypothetical protein